METKIDRIRELVIKSVSKAGERSAAITHPPHSMVEGTKVFIHAATDYLCSLVNLSRLEHENPSDDIVADAIAFRICKMLSVAGGCK